MPKKGFDFQLKPYRNLAFSIQFGQKLILYEWDTNSKVSQDLISQEHFI